ncbi:MAG: hypothetical protein Q9167_002877 [Letrouitia subvulpina]
MAKELESTQRRAEKTKGGKSAASRAANATSDAVEANRQWESQAPYVFEQLQALDETRTNHLRDVLTQLQTHEIDKVQRNRTSAESCLNALLNLNTADEISTFVAKTTSESPPTLRPRAKSKTAPGNTQPISTTRTQEDTVSNASRTSEGGQRSGYAGGSGSTPAPEQKRAGFGGLRRLGTVMGRRKEGKKTNERPPSPEKRSRPHFSALRRGTSSKNMQAIPSPDDDTIPSLPSSGPRKERTESQPTRSQTDAMAPSTPENRRTTGRPNGDSITPLRSSSLPIPNGIQPKEATPDQERLTTTPFKAPEAQRDLDGFNVPPSASDEITRAQQEAAATEPDQPQFKLDIRSEPIREEGGDPNSALSSVANTLRAAPETPPLPGDSPIPPSSSPNTARSNTLSADGPQSSDTHSIRSAHSMSSLANTAVRHPEMTQPGLNVSVVETVSAWFSQGQVTKAAVIGELALAHNPPSEKAPATVPPNSDKIRLENFPVLEKVAPNPTFITQIPSRSGEYVVSLPQITSRTAVAFKYQVHLEEANLAAHVPFILHPSWKCEAAQTLVIVNYSFNPAFASSGGRSVALKNLVIVVQLDSTPAGGKAQACQSKPVGNFSKEKSLIYWRVGDLTLDGYAEAPQKLLARFSTEGEAKPGSVEARWEISGDGAAGLGSGLSLSQMSGGSGWTKETEGSSGSGDPFADEGTGASGGVTGPWKEAPVVRKLISGKYTTS